ncbi:MAG TPA: hypothetical protein VG323_10400 [Thermoanaerobaculia bacterium]|nr:hypothetical protein [Thermoanaerobaculia bacterium]
MQVTKTHALVKRLVPAVAVWAIGRALDQPGVKKRLQKVDERVYKKRVIATDNARQNKAWLAAGAAACVIGLGMIARAVKR